MDLARKVFDGLYDATKPLVFAATRKDPEVAHELFISLCQRLYENGIDKLVLDNENNRLHPPYEISNAAGLNKNADIPPHVLKYMGFDRVVIGTVTYDAWKGNERPRCVRFPETESMVNWLGLPGVGALKIVSNLTHYGNHGVPLTINLMATPGKKGDEACRDIENTILATRHLPFVDRYTLNISCPNTEGSSGAFDARKEYQSMNGDLLRVVFDNVLPHQQVFEKLSPDLEKYELRDTCDVAEDYSQLAGFVGCNTSRHHDWQYIKKKLKIGGASGNAVYDLSFTVQRMLEQEIERRNKDWKIIACGGINSQERALIRTANPSVCGIQVYTPLIFGGPRFVRKLRRYNPDVIEF